MIGLMRTRRHRARMAAAEHAAELARTNAIVHARAAGAESARKNVADLLHDRARTRRIGWPDRRLTRSEAAVEALLADEDDEIAALVHTPPPTLTEPKDES